MPAHKLPPGLLELLEPAEPILARAGQVTLFNYATLHSASHVTSRTRVRKVWLTQFVRGLPPDVLATLGTPLTSLTRGAGMCRGTAPAPACPTRRRRRGTLGCG